MTFGHKRDMINKSQTMALHLPIWRWFADRAVT